MKEHNLVVGDTVTTPRVSKPGKCKSVGIGTGVGFALLRFISLSDCFHREESSPGVFL